MKTFPIQSLERARDLAAELEFFGECFAGTGIGIFNFLRDRVILRIVSSHDPEWEHVSVSAKETVKRGGRCPTWEEMCWVKDLFWDPEEVVMQLHPPKSEWVSNHRYCLHLWRPVQLEIPKPPAIYVGIKEEGEMTPRRARQLALERRMMGEING